MRTTVRWFLLFPLLLACGDGDATPAEPIHTGATGSELPAHAAGAAAFPNDPAREPLAPEVIALLEGLETDIEVRLVASSNLPPPYSTTAAEVRAILAQHARHSGHLRLVDVAVDLSQTEVDGIPRRTIPVIEGQVYRTIDAFHGAVIRSPHGERVLTALDDAEAFERQLVRHLRLLSHPPYTIGVAASLYSEGADPTLGLEELLGHYRVRAVDLDTSIDPELRALLLVAPRALPEATLRHLVAYLKQGGRLAVFGGGVTLRFDDPAAPTAGPGDPGLRPLLEPWGVAMGDRLVLDPQCVQVPLRTAVGLLAVPYPPGPTIPLDEDHPLQPVDGDVNMLFTGALTLSDAFGGEVWLRSSDQSTELALDARQPFGLEPRDPADWPAGEVPGSRPVLVAMEGALALPSGAGRTPDTTRLLVGGGDAFLRPDFRPQPPPGRDMSAHSIPQRLIDWLVGDGPSDAGDASAAH